MTQAAATKTSHTVSWDPPPERGRYAGANGLQAMKQALADGGTRSPISALMDFDLVSAELGHVVFEGRPGPQHGDNVRLCCAVSCFSSKPS